MGDHGKSVETAKRQPPEQRMKGAAQPKKTASANHYHLFDETTGSLLSRIGKAMGKAAVDCIDQNLRAAGDAIIGKMRQ